MFHSVIQFMTLAAVEALADLKSDWERMTAPQS
jgi:hypothetical protein